MIHGHEDYPSPSLSHRLRMSMNSEVFTYTSPRNPVVCLGYLLNLLNEFLLVRTDILEFLVNSFLA
jgi:hypothetical protein